MKQYKILLGVSVYKLCVCTRVNFLCVFVRCSRLCFLEWSCYVPLFPQNNSTTACSHYREYIQYVHEHSVCLHECVFTEGFLSFQARSAFGPSLHSYLLIWRSGVDAVHTRRCHIDTNPNAGVFQSPPARLFLPFTHFPWCGWHLAKSCWVTFTASAGCRSTEMMSHDVIARPDSACVLKFVGLRKVCAMGVCSSVWDGFALHGTCVFAKVWCAKGLFKCLAKYMYTHLKVDVCHSPQCHPQVCLHDHVRFDVCVRCQSVCVCVCVCVAHLRVCESVAVPDFSQAVPFLEPVFSAEWGNLSHWLSHAMQITQSCARVRVCARTCVCL